jgi:hypothetical protein
MLGALHVHKTMQVKDLSQILGYKQWALHLLKTCKWTSQRSSPAEDTKYLLVLVCTYSGWVEAYPAHIHRNGMRDNKGLLERN